MFVQITYSKSRHIFFEPGRLVIEVEPDSGALSGKAFEAGVVDLGMVSGVLAGINPVEVCAQAIERGTVRYHGGYINVFVTYARRAFHILKDRY